jgi:hypothetical protein
MFDNSARGPTKASSHEQLRAVLDLYLEQPGLLGRRGVLVSHARQARGHQQHEARDVGLDTARSFTDHMRIPPAWISGRRLDQAAATAPIRTPALGPVRTPVRWRFLV